MKRLFALVGIIYLAVQTAAFYTNITLALIIAVIAFVIGFVCLIFVKDKYKKRTYCIACAAAVAAGMVFYLYVACYFLPAQNEYNQQEVTVYAQLADEPHKSYGMYYYELKVNKVNGEDENFKLLLKSANQLEIQPFDFIECTVTPEKCANNYYLSKNFLYSVTADYDMEYTVTEPESYPLYYYAVQARQYMKNAIDTLMPKPLSSLSKAIALGDKFALDSNLRSDFQKTGISYLIVVSGLHLAIVSNFMLALFRKIFRNRYISTVVTMLFIFAFMAITGFTSSVVRSGIMLIIYLFGKLIYYEADSMNSLGFAALCLCVFNPLASGDVGLLLSFSATAGIILFSNPAADFVLSKVKRNKFFPAIKYLVKTLSVTLSAFIMILPITLLWFNSFSPIVFVVSAIITPFISVLIVCILLCSVLYYCGVFSALAYPFALIACVINKFIIFVVELFADLNISTIYVSTVNAVIFLCAGAILIALALLFKDYKNKLKYSAFMLVVIVLAGWSFSVLPGNDSLQVVKSGEGSAVILNSCNGIAVLSCGGSASGTSEVIKTLELNNSQISLLVVPDNNKSSSRYASDILEEFNCAAVMLYNTDKTDESAYRLSKQAQTLLTFSENQTAGCNLWDDYTLQALNVDGYTWEYVYSDGYSVLIVPKKGDCADIPLEYRTADIIIAAALPENYTLLSCNLFVYTGSGENLKTSADSIALISRQIASTAENSVTVTLE